LNVEENMATGLYVLQDGSVTVAYGLRHIPISRAQYQANGYKPIVEKLPAKAADAEKRKTRPENVRRRVAVSLLIAPNGWRAT
jgi:hypothetical protein